MTEELRDLLLERFEVRLLRLRGDRPRDRDGGRVTGEHRRSVGSPGPGRTSGRRSSAPTRACRWSSSTTRSSTTSRSTTPARSCARSAASTSWRRGSATTSTTPAGCCRSPRSVATLRRYGYDIRTLGTAPETAGPRGRLPWSRPIPLPFLWIYGRRDATISVMGANIYPEDIETIVYGDAASSRRLESFLLTGGDAERHAAAGDRPGADRRRGVDDAWPASLVRAPPGRPRALNADYRESIDEFPAAMQPIVTSYAPGGPVRRRRQPDQAAAHRPGVAPCDRYLGPSACGSACPTRRKRGPGHTSDAVASRPRGRPTCSPCGRADD